MHKKEINREIKPPPPPKVPKPREKVKIMISKLSDFKDDDDDEGENRKVQNSSNKKTGLLRLLPKPNSGISIGPSPKPEIPSISNIKISQGPEKSVTSAPAAEKSSPQIPSSSTDLQTKKIGLIPYALMDHKKATDGEKKTTKVERNESDSEEEEGNPSSFFTFSSKNELDDLPKVSDEEIKSLIAKEANKVEQRKRQAEMSKELDDEFQQNYQPATSQLNQQSIDRNAMSALVGGNKAKRSKFEEIEIVDLSANDVLPDRSEWIRKTLAGETGYIPTGQIDEKVSN